MTVTGAMITVVLAEIPSTRLYVRTSIPGQVVRWCSGEELAAQWVNDTTDGITSLREADELQKIGDGLMSEFGPINQTLPESPYRVYERGKLLPLGRLPLKFRKLGGMFGDEPDLVPRVNDNGEPDSVIISWGHMRQSITIFSKAPITASDGFFVRKLNDRIYVRSGEN